MWVNFQYLNFSRWLSRHKELQALERFTTKQSSHFILGSFKKLEIYLLNQPRLITNYIHLHAIAKINRDSIVFLPFLQRKHVQK